MSRRKLYKLAAVGVLLGVVGFAWGRGGPDGPAQPTDLQYLWQWDLARVTPPGRLPQPLYVILRSRHTPLGEQVPGPMAVPLRVGEGAESVMGMEIVYETPTDESRLTVQVVDLRHLAVAVAEPDCPLRAQTMLKMYGSRMKSAAKLEGHSVRSQPVAHTGGWAGGERPLLSLATIGSDGFHEYTFVLTTRPPLTD